VVKGHPSHPGTSELFAAAVLAALQDRNLPRGLFGLLQGRRHELSALLVQHPSTQAVGFTGSQKAGRALFDMAAARPRPIPVFAEMGSLNPVVILPNAMAERGETIAKELTASLLLGGGQFCTKPGLLLTVGAKDESFVESLARQISANATVTMLNQGLRDNFAGRAGTFAKVSGLRTVVDGRPSGHAGHAPVLWETTAEIWLREPHLHEEAFGPGGLVIHCKDIDEAIACVRDIGGSLTGTILAGQHESKETVTRVLRGLENTVGRVVVNGYPTGVEVGHAIVHGGPYPATTDPASTSVGTAALRRFTRLVAYQDTPDALLPAALRNANPLGIARVINGEHTNRAI
jgi:2,5-dioxopentanoate dehydrogenase